MTRFVSLSVKFGAKLATMATSSGVLLALNSLASDGIVRLTREEHQQFEALVEDYFNVSDGSDDDSGRSDDDLMECGKFLFNQT